MSTFYTKALTLQYMQVLIDTNIYNYNNHSMNKISEGQNSPILKSYTAREGFLLDKTCIIFVVEV